MLNLIDLLDYRKRNGYSYGSTRDILYIVNNNYLGLDPIMLLRLGLGTPGIKVALSQWSSCIGVGSLTLEAQASTSQTGLCAM